MTVHLEITLRDDNGDEPPRRICVVPNVDDGSNIYIRLSSFNDSVDHHPVQDVNHGLLEVMFDAAMVSPLSEAPQVFYAGDDEQAPKKQISFFRRRASSSSEGGTTDVVLDGFLYELKQKMYEQYASVYGDREEEEEEEPMNRGSVSGESSSPPTVFCKICMEPTSIYDSFSSQGCSHVFCNECISQHIAAKVGENCKVVKCPEEGCKAVLDFDICKQFLRHDVFERWGRILCESSIDNQLIVYCPFKDCSALMLGFEKEGVVDAVCPHCDRVFCVRCKSPWHEGINCSEYQKLGENERAKEDIMLRNLAKNKQWGRCSRCGYYVEKTEGCSYMVCRLVICS